MRAYCHDHVAEVAEGLEDAFDGEKTFDKIYDRAELLVDWERKFFFCKVPSINEASFHIIPRNIVK